MGPFRCPSLMLCSGREEWTVVFVSVRSLSYSEISTALTCWARWEFAYGDRLAGSALRSKQVAAVLSNGRAWGAAVAAWHGFSRPLDLQSDATPSLARIAAHEALRASYADDVSKQRNSGVYVLPDVQVGQEAWLGEVLDHYCSTVVKLQNLSRIEGELSLPLPSRTGQRASNRYRFEGYLDGFTVDEFDHNWLYEAKLRTSLTPAWQIQLSRQIRWYAWAYRQETERDVVGVLVDERLAEAPKPPRIVQAKKKGEGIDGLRPSHTKDQLTTSRWYVDVCNEYGVEPNPVTIMSLDARVWQQRIPVTFRRDELDEAGHELVAAATLIRDLDAGSKYPIRNAQPQLCRGCRFRQICAAPEDELYVDTLFDRVPPKRDRSKIEEGRQDGSPVRKAA